MVLVLAVAVESAVDDAARDGLDEPAVKIRDERGVTPVCVGAVGALPETQPLHPVDARAHPAPVPDEDEVAREDVGDVLSGSEPPTTYSQSDSLSLCLDGYRVAR